MYTCFVSPTQLCSSLDRVSWAEQSPEKKHTSSKVIKATRPHDVFIARFGVGF
jgi:hypothetical protein